MKPSFCKIVRLCAILANIMIIPCRLFLAVAVALLHACGTSPTTAKLSTYSTTVCGKPITLEVVKTNEEKSAGLMNRSGLPSNHGMLFVYDNDQVLTFWMKNVSFPISIGFFDSLGRLISHEEMVPESPSVADHMLKRYSSSKAVRYGVEMSANWFEKETPTCVIDLGFLQ